MKWRARRLSRNGSVCMHSPCSLYALSMLSLCSLYACAMQVPGYCKGTERNQTACNGTKRHVTAHIMELWWKGCGSKQEACWAYAGRKVFV
jgi:hypothetical protein